MTRGPKPGGRRKGEEKRGLCTWCGESKRRLEFGAGRWRHKDSAPLVCLACKPIAMRAKDLEMEYAFARDIVGMDHRRALQWLADHSDRALDYLEKVFGYDVAKPYRHYEFEPIKEVTREVIEYEALSGEMVTGTVWCEGPKDKTVWVIRPDNTAAVVIPASTDAKKSREVVYELPEKPVCVYPQEIIDTANAVLERYATAQKDLIGLGYVQPIGQDYAVAAAILSAHRRAQRARLPFLATRAHPAAVAQPLDFTAKGEIKKTSDTTRLPVSLKRIRELQQKDIEG